VGVSIYVSALPGECKKKVEYGKKKIRYRSGQEFKYHKKEQGMLNI
jgi:hypothetical protein